MRVLIIAHPNTGIIKEKRSTIDRIVSSLSNNGGSVDVTYTFKPGIGKIHSSRAGLEGYDAVLAAGGDGTVNDVASGLVGRPIPMGIIPLGTGNGMARSLGIPLDTDKLIEMLSEFNTKAIDVGKISSKFFTATAGVGFDASIAHEFNSQQKNNRRMSSYFLIGVKNYFLRSSERLILIADGKEITRTVFGLTIANVSQYGGGAKIAPQANPQSGELIAVLIPKFSMFKALPMIYKLFNGTVQSNESVEYIPFKTLKIKREQAGTYHVDGETFKGNVNLNVSVIPQSLTIIVP
ncbi:diacylglycerol/lipid kinase family protein [Candidatus Latescibacterota bacterium]